MTDTLYTVLHADVTISNGAGKSFSPAVSSIELSLESGGIPTIRTLIDPYHMYDDKTGTAMSVGFQRLARATEIIHAIVATGKGRGSIRVEVVATDGTDTQSFAVKDWILTASGVAGLGTGGFDFELEFQHPAFKLDTPVGNVGNLDTNIPPSNWSLAATTAMNPVMGLASTFLMLSRADRHADGSKLDDPQCNKPVAGGESQSATLSLALNKINKRIAQQAETILKTLLWTPTWPNNTPGYSDFPLGNTCLSTDMFEARMAYVTMVANNATSSPLGVLSAIMPHYDLTIIPTYWRDTLGLTPFSPWANPVTVILESELSSPVDYPGVDPRPVGGVLIQITPTAASSPTDVYLQDIQAVKAANALRSVVYVPQAFSDDDGGGGYIMQMSEPAWLPLMMAARKGKLRNSPQAGLGSKNVYVGNHVKPGATPGASPGGGSEANKGFAPGVWAGAAQAFAHAAFNASFKANSEINLTTKLMINSKRSLWDGNYVTPGCVVRLAGDSATKGGSSGIGDTLLDFYATRVTHVINVKANAAYTRWTGTYCRAKGAYAKIVATGTYNPLYGGG